MNLYELLRVKPETTDTPQTETLQIGDMVKIHGARILNRNGQCAYTADQLIDGYVKHAWKNEPWVGVIKHIDIPNQRASVGGCWRYIDTLCKI